MASSRNNALEFSSAGSIVINAADGATAGSFGAIQFLRIQLFQALTATNVIILLTSLQL